MNYFLKFYFASSSKRAHFFPKIRFSKSKNLVSSCYYTASHLVVKNQKCDTNTMVPQCGFCKALSCWETFFGQTFYRFLATGVIAGLGKVIFYEYPYNILRNKWKWAGEKLPILEFDYVKEVLDLIYWTTFKKISQFVLIFELNILKNSP